MECYSCSSTHKPFWCTRCLSKRLHTYVATQAALAKERETLAQRIASFHGRTRPPSGISPAEEAFSTQKRIAALQADIDYSREQIRQRKLEAQDLRRTLQDRRTRLSDAFTTLRLGRTRLLDLMHKDIEETHKQYTQSADVLMQSRRLLVRELLSIFKLRKVQRRFPKSVSNTTIVQSFSASSSSATRPQSAIAATAPGIIEYRIVNVPLPIFGYTMSVPRERFNAAIGHTIHMCVLLFQYLHVNLPYFTVNKGENSYAQAQHVVADEASRMPLYLTDNNAESFIVGLSMLNYNIAFLCHTQGVHIPIYDVPNTLENLVLCCQASNLGREWSRRRPPPPPLQPAPTNQPDTVPPPPQLNGNDPFFLEFNKVVQLHVALHKRRWAASALARLCAGKQQQQEQQQQSAATISTTATDIDVRNTKLLQQILDENSEDEAESSEWHLVDEIVGAKTQYP
ncbi:hypothetical protein PhCBS80983_g03612 [Powellomyces hirtus]|uniref:Autophagy-related protein 14 n=1 Tax=Powellomyces hirtus TaxID=109895 RepID=A0A507E316_9FUNG|nr:hypothetical protein PhCBS80983_g03612 [Powellomyces hirtus]